MKKKIILSFEAILTDEAGNYLSQGLGGEPSKIWAVKTSLDEPFDFYKAKIVLESLLNQVIEESKESS